MRLIPNPRLQHGLWFLANALVILAVGCSAPDTPQQPSSFEHASPTEATLFAPGIVSLSERVEFGITFTPDARTAYFTSKPSDDAPYAIYVAHDEDGQWLGPSVASFSGAYFDADPFITADGSRLFFFSMRPQTGFAPQAAPDIWYVERVGTGWSSAINLGPPVSHPESGEGFVTATGNGTLYFSAMNRTDATSTHDVYRAAWIDSAYAPPEYLSLQIEAAYSNPFIAPSEAYLIIDSKQDGGYGGADLYVIYREATGWSVPQNLGPRVNTAGEEGTPSLSPDGRLLFFSRDGDIYHISVAAVESLHGPTG